MTLQIFSFLKGLYNIPARCEKWLRRGNIFYQKGEYARALLFYQKILRRQPQNLPALCNRGNILFFQKKYDAALSDATQMIRFFQNSPLGYSLRGRILLEREDFSSAAADLQTALRLDPDDFWNWNYFSQALQGKGIPAAALEAAFHAVELSGGEDSQQLNLAYALYEISEEKGADFVLPTVQKWHNQYKKNPIVMHSCQSYFADKIPEKASAEYIEKLFDNFAVAFDETLSALDYVAPQKIAAAAAELLPPGAGASMRILDLGCGTGLCAEALAGTLGKGILTGVDLSASMLEKARGKKLYTQLEKMEIEEYLQTSKTIFDLVVAADVLTYFGALEKVFAGVYSVLKKGGFFIFSITQNQQNENNCFLHPSGRFAHTQTYVEKALLYGGFRDIILRKAILRREGKNKVCGWIVSARK